MLINKSIVPTLFITAIIISGCCSTFQGEPEIIRRDIELVKYHEKLFASKMSKERGWFKNGSGGAMMHDIKKIMITFEVPSTANLDQSRALIVETTQLYLNEINSDEELKPFLNVSPFGPKNLEVGLLFPKDCRNENNIGSVDLSLGVIRYSILGKDGFYQKVHEETFEEALQKLGR